MNSLRRRFALLSFALLVSVPLLTACPFDPYYPPPPLSYDFKGMWSGTLTDSRGGEGTLTLVFNYQTDYTFGGSWQANFGAAGTQGVFEGRTEPYDSTVSASLYLAELPNCALEIKGGRDEDTVSGTYRAAASQPESCATVAFGLGAFTITKRVPVE